jgi:hypothetical protein
MGPPALKFIEETLEIPELDELRAVRLPNG